MSNPLFDILRMREGEDYSRAWTFTTIASWAGASVALMIRTDVGQTSPDLSLTSTPAAGIVLSVDAQGSGVVTVAVTPTQIAGLISGAFGARRRGAMSVVMTDSLGKKTTLVEGIAEVLRMPTR